ncbi:MAG: aromatic ring-hydroxylating dioxygenase subunit alpha [Pseudomonadota bacterium]|nr:aromatic ring-hydroxylating dioxygenase subunit alpha [Pseudomonadota bacterium]
MYSNFWYPLERSEKITTDEPLRIDLLGMGFVTFRDGEGIAHVLADTCVHRGGSLSNGQIKNGRVACPYHGWEFDGNGKCAKVPSLGDKKIPARAKVDSYPVQERYGIVFAFLGDLPEEERPPLYDIEEYGSKKWRSQLYVLNIDCNYERSIENGLDPIHNEFVHPSQGAPSLSMDYQSGGVPTEDIPYGVKFYLPYPNKVSTDTKLESAKTGKKVGASGSWVQGPNQVVTWIDLTAENSFHQYIFEAPVDDSHTRIFFLNMRSWLLDEEHDMRIEKPTMTVVDEDINILEKLRPIRTPVTNTKEIMVPGDAVIMRYRELLSEWDAKGWRIDYKRLQQERDDIAFAIPCPERRSSKNWVLDAIPLQPGGDQALNRRKSSSAA